MKIKVCRVCGKRRSQWLEPVLRHLYKGKCFKTLPNGDNVYAHHIN